MMRVTLEKYLWELCGRNRTSGQSRMSLLRCWTRLRLRLDQNQCNGPTSTKIKTHYSGEVTTEKPPLEVGWMHPLVQVGHGHAYFLSRHVRRRSYQETTMEKVMQSCSKDDEELRQRKHQKVYRRNLPRARYRKSASRADRGGAVRTARSITGIDLWYECQLGSELERYVLPSASS